MSKTIALFPEASFGAALNCVGIAQELRRMGHNIVFICHPGFSGVFAEYGFAEHQLGDGKAAGTADWNSFIATYKNAFRQSSMEQLDSYVAPTWDVIVDTAVNAEQPLRQLLARLKPDLIVVDNVITFPAIAQSGVPWVRVVSCAETELPDPNVPPYLSGLGLKDRGPWADFRSAYEHVVEPAHRRYNQFRTECGLSKLASGVFMETSPYLNLLLAPDIVRFDRENALDSDRFLYLEGCVRREAPYRVPRFAAHDDAPLVLTSFGSLGAMDVEMVHRMIAVFADMPYRFIVNVGSWREDYGLMPDNVVVDSWLPQPSVVSQASLFIHHGGNNSFCEALYYGVPSLIMPFCWDGHDNAIRVEEAGVGASLPRYTWAPEELRAKVAALVGDLGLRARLQENAAQMQAAPGTRQAAEAIEKVAAHSASLPS